MIKMLTATTPDADDMEYAYEEIMNQLDMENSALKNSAAYITSTVDFVETGALDYILKRFQIPVVGSVMLANATEKDKDMVSLSVAVFTSDDVEFSVSHVELLRDNPKQKVEKAYAELTKDHSGDPYMVMPLFSATTQMATDEMFGTVYEAGRSTKLFGGIACGKNITPENSYAFIGDKMLPDGMAMMAFWGDIDASFDVASIIDTKMQIFEGIITEAEGSVMKKINDVSAHEYMESIGINIKDMHGLVALPIMVKFKNQTRPVARAVYSVTPEGYFMCAGGIPEGGTASAGKIDKEDIISAARNVLEKEFKHRKVNGAIIFSCGSRYLSLGVDAEVEMEIVKEIMGDIPFIISYTSGEICPTFNDGRGYVNNFHNFTMAVCLF